MQVNPKILLILRLDNTKSTLEQKSYGRTTFG